MNGDVIPCVDCSRGSPSGCCHCDMKDDKGRCNCEGVATNLDMPTWFKTILEYLWMDDLADDLKPCPFCGGHYLNLNLCDDEGEIITDDYVSEQILEQYDEEDNPVLSVKWDEKKADSVLYAVKMAWICCDNCGGSMALNVDDKYADEVVIAWNRRA